MQTLVSPVAAFEALFNLLPTGVVLLTPVYDADHDIVDFAFYLLNPAAQHLLGLPARPQVTILQQLPHNGPSGLLARYRQAFASKERQQVDLPYQADGIDSFYRLLVQRVDDHLLVHITDLATLSAKAVRKTLRESQDATRTAQQEAQRQLRTILKQVPAAIAALGGPEHRFTFFNEQYQQLVGHRANLGFSVAEALPETVAQGFIALLDRVYQTGEPYVGSEIAILLSQPQGPPRQHYLTFTYQAQRNEQGLVQGILVSAVDVTAQVLSRKQAETLQAAMLNVVRRRAQERQDLLAVFAHAPVAVALLREPDHKLDYYNALFEQFYPGARQGRTLLELYPDLATPQFMAVLDHLYQTGEAQDSQTLRLPGATPRYVTFTYQAYREHGRIIGVALFLQDVTAQEVQRHQAAQATQQLGKEIVESKQELAQVLAEREASSARAAQRLQAIFAQAPLGIALFEGPDQVVTLANADVCAMWGTAPAQVLNRPLLEGVPELRGQGFERLLADVARTGQPFVGTEVAAELRQPDGTLATRYFNFVYQALRDPDGQTLGVLDIAIDVTEQVLTRQRIEQLNQELELRVEERTERIQQLNEELQVRNAQLTRINADLDTFVYTASHDLKGPIINIEGLVGALRHEFQEPALDAVLSERLLGMIIDSISRFQTTLTHLANITQLPLAGEVPAAPTELAPILEDVRLDLAPLLEATKARLVVDFTQCPGLRLSPKAVRSVFYNLLSNALKYRHPERTPVVRFQTSCSATQTSLTVQDNGLGLSPTQQQGLFQLFQRLHTHVEGSGVGLFSIKRLVENAEGTITVGSASQGQGTIFTITLPS